MSRRDQGFDHPSHYDDDDDYTSEENDHEHMYESSSDSSEEDDHGYQSGSRKKVNCGHRCLLVLLVLTAILLFAVATGGLDSLKSKVNAWTGSSEAPEPEPEPAVQAPEPEPEGYVKHWSEYTHSERRAQAMLFIVEWCGIAAVVPVLLTCFCLLCTMEVDFNSTDMDEDSEADRMRANASHQSPGNRRRVIELHANNGAEYSRTSTDGLIGGRDEVVFNDLNNDGEVDDDDDGNLAMGLIGHESQRGKLWVLYFGMHAYFHQVFVGIPIGLLFAPVSAAAGNFKGAMPGQTEDMSTVFGLQILGFLSQIFGWSRVCDLDTYVLKTTKAMPTLECWMCIGPQAFFWFGLWYYIVRHPKYAIVYFNDSLSHIEACDATLASPLLYLQVFGIMFAPAAVLFWLYWDQETGCLTRTADGNCMGTTG